jgi:hypothetical protein
MPVVLCQRYVNGERCVECRCSAIVLGLGFGELRCSVLPSVGWLVSFRAFSPAE